MKLSQQNKSNDYYQPRLIPDSQIVKEVRRVMDEPRKAHNTSLFVISILLFFFIGVGGLSTLNILYLVLVILLHELGHFAGMKLFGYSNPRIFFIPGVGAAAGADSRSEKAWHEIVVLLLGPIPGILLGVVLMFNSHLLAFPNKEMLIYMLIFINGFNLLPFVPLDGGRIMAEALFRKRPLLELLFRSAGIILLLAMAVALKDIIWTIFIIMFAATLRETYQKNRVMKVVREYFLNNELTEDEQIHYVCAAVQREYGHLYVDKVADFFKESHIQLMSRRGSVITTLLYGVILLVSFAGVLLGGRFMHSNKKNIHEELRSSTAVETIKENLN